MNLLEANSIDNLFNYIFADWTIALFIFFAVLILLSVLFKGLKVGIVLVTISAVIAGLTVLTSFAFMLMTWDILRIIDSAIKWGPTVLFVIIILISTLVNAKRGLRKSLILLAQAVGACIVCTVFFYVCVNSEEVDKAVLSIVNQVLGGRTLQGMLDVSESCTTIREIVAEWLPNVVGGDIKILLAANPEYIVTLVDMVFRIVFSVITVILYLLLVFLMYIIYFFAYPERRYKKKIKRAVEKNQTDRTYKKHHVGGGAVGLVRGVTVGLLTLSFMGSALFMVAGTGQGTMGDYDFDNDDYNFYYSIYRSVESYGSQGIFKVLNSMTDSSDTPFYLFAADMVLSGNLDDEDNGINDQNIKFREEIAAYTGFAKDALNLLMKYGKEDMTDIINGRGGNNAFDKIINIMTIPEFRAEFDVLIKEFDSQTYVINLGMSLITTVVEDLDEISFTSSLGEENKELLKLLFKKDYLSDTIPDELELKRKIEAGIISPSAVSRPRLKVSHLLTKDDIRIALEVAFSILAGEQDTSDILGLVKSLLPEVRQLSILQTARSSELDPVLTRLYCYYGNKYLTAEGEEGITYSSVAGKDIKWLYELNILMDITGDALTLWSNIYQEGKQPLDILLSVFDSDDPNYNENTKCFNSIRSALERSEIVGTVMSTSYITGMMKSAFTVISEKIYIPENIVYTRKVDADGNVVDEGELHKLFGGFMLLNSAQDGRLLDEILNIAGGNTSDVGAILSALSDALSSVDKDGKNLSYYLTESQLLRSLISIVMIDKGAEIIYIPNVALEKLTSGDSVNMIIKSELKSLFDNLATLIEFVQPILDGESESEYLPKIAEHLYSGELAELLASNRIVEGTVAKTLSKYLKDNEFIVVPAALVDDIDGWVTVNGKKGEMRKLLVALQAVEIDFVKIAEGNFNTEDLFDTILNIDETAVDTLLSSQILYYTLSKYIIDGTGSSGFKIIVPNGARVPTASGDVIPYTIQNKELKTLFEMVTEFDVFGEELDINSVLYKLVVNVDKLDRSKIMSASIVYTIVNNEEVQSAITLPQEYINKGGEAALLDYNSSNPWSQELKRFIYALDEILGISIGEDFVFDSESIQDSLSTFLTQLNKSSRVNPEKTKLGLCYESVIIKSEITVRLDETLLGNNIVPEDVIRDTKQDGYYTKEEVQALASSLEIFGIDDLLGTTGDEMISKVTDMVFTLNDPLEEYDNRTALQVIYSSNIIRYIFSSQIDNALENTVNKEVINQIKGARNYYPVQDIADFIDAAREMDIAQFDNIADFDFSAIEDLLGTSHLFPESGKSRLAVIYSSRIAAGVVTNSLYSALNAEDATGVLVDHPKAYREDLKVYKLSEIESLFEVFGNLEEIDINTVDLKKVSLILYDENLEDKTRSWLIASAISKIFLDNENFIIPGDIVEDGCIKPVETSLIISVFSDLYDGKSMEDLEDWELEEIPTGETRKKLFASEIMRARVTYNLGEESSTSGKPVFISSDRVKFTSDTKGVNRLVILGDELIALTNALDAIGGSGGSTFAIPSLQFSELAKYDDATIEALLNSDIMYYKVCECLLANSAVKLYLARNNITPDKVEPINLATGKTQEREVISKQTIMDFLAQY